MPQVKLLAFLGDSLARLREFPEEAKTEAGVQLHKVQQGLEPSDWKSLPTIGPGVLEIRIREESGAFRVVYVANRQDKVFVLYAFQKKTQATAKRDLDLASLRLRSI